MELRSFRNLFDEYHRNDHQSQNKAVNVAKVEMVAARRETRPSAVGRFAAGLRWHHCASCSKGDHR